MEGTKLIENFDTYTNFGTETSRIDASHSGGTKVAHTFDSSMFDLPFTTHQLGQLKQLLRMTTQPPTTIENLLLTNKYFVYINERVEYSS